MLQWRFYALEEINVSLIKEYVIETIENIKLGKEIKPNKTKKELIIPEEFLDEMSSNEELKDKYNSLTNGKQREYADYISEAKREITKQKRLQKIIPNRLV